MEMKEVAFICRNAGPRSLVLIDELGRATSNEDGVAIAWSVSEYLRTKGTSTFFVTHYPQLTKLADIYPGIWNQHMGATIAQDGGAILYSHTIQNGPCQLASDYGLEVAATCGWPHEVVEAAKEIRLEIESLLPDCTAPVVVSATEIQDKRKRGNALVELCNQLKGVGNFGNEQTFREKLDGLRKHLMDQGGPGAMSSLRSTMTQIRANGAGVRSLDAHRGVDRQSPEEFGGTSACQIAEVCESSLSGSSTSNSSESDKRARMSEAVIGFDRA